MWCARLWSGADTGSNLPGGMLGTMLEGGASRSVSLLHWLMGLLLQSPPSRICRHATGKLRAAIGGPPPRTLQGDSVGT